MDAAINSHPEAQRHPILLRNRIRLLDPHPQLGRVVTPPRKLPLDDPLAEQRRIVAKVEQLIALVDALETQLAASRATAANLLSALVAELTAAHAA